MLIELLTDRGSGTADQIPSPGLKVQDAAVTFTTGTAYSV